MRRSFPSVAPRPVASTLHGGRTPRPRRAPGCPHHPRRSDGPCRQATPSLSVACFQRRHRTGGERAASILAAPLSAVGRPHRHSITDSCWFIVSRSSRSHGHMGHAPHGARAPALPPSRRPLRGLARLHRRACQRRRGLLCAVPLAAMPSAGRRRRSSQSTSTTSAPRWRPGAKARGSMARPTASGARA